MGRAAAAELAMVLLVPGVATVAQTSGWSSETREVCLVVTAIDCPTTAEVAAHVMGGIAHVVDPADKCCDKPVPTTTVPRDDLLVITEGPWDRIGLRPAGSTIDVDGDHEPDVGVTAVVECAVRHG